MGGLNMRKLSQSRHLAGLTKEIVYDGFSGADTTPEPRVSKSYCANSDLFIKAFVSRPRKLSKEEYQRQAEFLRSYCSR